MFSPDALIWYASIFCWLYFTGIGIPPCPEEAGILYAAGVAAIHPNVHPLLAWPVTSAGIVCADLTLYGIGRLWGQRMFQTRWFKWLLRDERRPRIETRFHEHGVKLLMAARFLPPLRTGVFIIAGTIRFSFVRFLIADGLFAVIGVGAIFLIATWIIERIHQWGHWLPFVIVGLLAAYALYRYYRYLRRREMKGNPPAPVSVLELSLGKAPGAKSEGVKTERVASSAQSPPSPQP
jgi:membrane protein DedA with SNARE-associated domain